MSRPWQLEVALEFCLISVDKGNIDWPVKELSVFARGWTQEQISRCYNTSHTRIMLGYLYYEYPVTFIFKLLQDLFSRVRPSNHFKLQRIFRPSNKNLFPKLTEVLDGRNKLGSGVGELWFFLVFIFYSYCQELSQDQYVSRSNQTLRGTSPWEYVPFCGTTFNVPTPIFPGPSPRVYNREFPTRIFQTILHQNKKAQRLGTTLYFVRK